MKTKDNTIQTIKLHPDLKELMVVIDPLWGLCFKGNDCVLTSGHEETTAHSVKSKHYIRNNPSGYGCAIDIRINDVTLNEGHNYFAMILMYIKLFFDDRVEVMIERIPNPDRHLHFQVKNN